MNKRKIVVILGDGMADYPDAQGRTPLTDAHKPNIDKMAARAELGLCQTIPDGMKPGSDTANLSVMGYDPKIYYTGRSPLEAVSIGIKLEDSDVTYRCNLVSLAGDGDYEQKSMLDYSSGEITTAESTALIRYLAENLPLRGLDLYAGVSYRHCLVRRSGATGAILTPPHDISDKPIGDYLPRGAYAEELLSLMKASYALLRDHPVNAARRARGLRTADSIWLWGEGKKPVLDRFEDKFGMKGAVISAVDLIKGIGISAGMDSIDVEGATGTVDTNFDGKAAAAIEALKTHDFVYVHLEAPDECGHQGNRAEKTRAIELIDEKIVGPIKRALDGTGAPYRLLVIPDHATPTALRTH